MTLSTSQAQLVLVHPIGNDAECWQFMELDNALKPVYPGHGDRPRQPGWSHRSMADEIVKETSGPLDLVGVAVGASVVQHILANYPDRVRSAVLACTGAPNPSADPEIRLRTATERTEPALKNGMQAVIDSTLRRWFTPFAFRTGGPGIEYARRKLLAMDPMAWSDIQFAPTRNAPVDPARLASLTQPVTIVAASFDASAGVAGAFALHDLIPNSRLEIIPGPHMVHLERPANLVGAIGRHFKWLPIGNRVEAALGSSGE